MDEIKRINISPKTHVVFLIVSVLVLLIVQYQLISNTYSLKNKQYRLEEQQVINDLYSASIRNDKVYPGGQRIVDSFINRRMLDLSTIYKRDKVAFQRETRLLLDSVITEMRDRSNMDRLFQTFVQKGHLPSNLKYLLTINDITIKDERNQYIPLFSEQTLRGHTSPLFYPRKVVVIDGTLKHPGSHNLTSSYTVSSPSENSYQLSFSLYVDRTDRDLILFKMMLPTLTLSLISILGVVLINYITFRNWVKQKKLAEMKSDFLNSITHEFNTPLSTILVANRSLQNEKLSSKTENIHSLTEVINRQTLRLQSLFQQVIDITKTSKATLKKNEYNLNEVLDEVLLDYRLKIAEEPVTISFNKGTNINPVQLNKFWFTTMLFNIFNNAIKYNDKNQKEIIVTTTTGKNGIEIHVKDNGIGIPARNVKHIFEKFFRGNKNELSSIAGLGLGLFYVKQCVDTHGWQIGVISKEDIGSEFIIQIG
ncbi:two-component system phosphate regulon sensor histidine kinase PhoR [Arcticibacter tournemirensis]|uniref:histidine kinase n=1 Tax=Arcticibacter tournemirensis TaxID=699437 RepID=A0A5M9GTW4_9SPHI|nr:HAMP domain-containing sensor histidine kinase [Arcticibacter tournemirensis]KAA8477195.1 HAMP domain-containing histidine kinase [Arcticibacter tournemirensis]TQM50191.1 two-component system phosphate regulon sensor histidine kinase PhoR [Arcticibacter tournemirensis]